MQIFLTGATGVIGRRLVPALVAAGHDVRAVARNREKSSLLAGAGAVPVVLDPFDADAVRSAVRGADAVINMATAVPKSSRAMMPGAWRENSRVRRELSATLARAVRESGVRRFIQESFAPIYADGGREWITETSPVRPARYNRAVMDAERAALGGHSAVGVVLRFGFFYGPDSDFTADAVKLVRRGWAPSFGDPDGFISSIAHDDAAAAVVAALDIPAGIYNVVDDSPVTKREFAASLAAAAGVAPPRHLPRWTARLAGSIGETLSRSQRISNGALRGASAWTPRYATVTSAWPDVLRGLTSF